MSPKSCSLALEEIELEDRCPDECFEPELKVVVNKRLRENSSIDEDVITISGRINVSF
ncbi:MAG: hypothetical protein AAGG81_05385 [Chlamydiota bacterium]